MFAVAKIINLYGCIKEDDDSLPSWFFEDDKEDEEDFDCFCLNDFMSAYAEAGNDELIINISSDGGAYKPAIDIYNVLKKHPAKVTTVCMGTALSGAALIMQAGQTRLMTAASVMMIHQASSLFCGYLNSSVCLDLSQQFEAYDNINYSAFSERTGISKDILKQYINGKEYWLTPEKALAENFIDGIEGVANKAMIQNSGGAVMNWYHPPAHIKPIFQKNTQIKNSHKENKDMPLSSEDKKMIAEIASESTAAAIQNALKEPIENLSKFFTKQAEKETAESESAGIEAIINKALEPVLAQNAQLKTEIEALKSNPVNNKTNPVYGLLNDKNEGVM